MELETCLVAPDDWKRATIEGICTKFTSGGTPSRQRPEFYQNGVVPWVKTKELLDIVLRDAEEWITEQAISSSSAKRLPRDTVLMAMYGATVGQLGILGVEMSCNQACAAMVVDDAKCDYRFLYYLLLANRRQIVSLATGAAQQNLSGSQIKGWTIALPEREEQRAIADVLATLDDKIELNRRMNQTLEAMARAVFKSWFVDFDDVPLADMQESVLGLIPKGWRVEALGHHLSVLETGRRPKGGVKGISEGVPSVGAESIIGIGQFDFGKTRFVTEDFFVGMKSGHVQSLDVMLYKDGGKPGDFRPRVSMFGEGFPFERYAINEHVFRMRSESLGQAFLFLQISHDRILTDLRNRGGKAAIPGINQKDVTTLQVVVPDKSVLESFNSLVAPMLEAILKRANESRLLARLRDALLPKLLSGELRVTDAEKAAGDLA